MIDHPAFPYRYPRWQGLSEEEQEQAKIRLEGAETAFRSLVSYIRMAGTQDQWGNWVIALPDWQSLRKAAGLEKP